MSPLFSRSSRILLPIVALVAATASSAAAARAVCTSERVPAPGRGTLNAISAVSPTDIWAVGSQAMGDPYPIVTFVEHWDGVAWSIVPSPNQTDFLNSLVGVSALAPDDVWAVGYHQTYIYGTKHTLIEHWDGTEWSIVPSPNPSAYMNQLTAVHASAPDDAWAVGSNVHPTNRASVDTLTLHWDGVEWRVVHSPNAFDPANGENANTLWSVDAAGPTDVWTAGNFGSDDNSSGYNSTLAMKWDGSAWSRSPSPNPKPIDYFRGVRVFSPTEIWAAGYTLTDRYARAHPLVGWTDGTTWFKIQTKDLPVGWIYGLAATSSTDVWIAGNGESTRFLARWDGTSWTLVDPPHGPRRVVWAVTSAGPGDVWTVGWAYGTGFSETYIEHATCA